MQNLNIVIIDYGLGNIFSIKNALKFLGYSSIFTDDPGDIRMADIVILPGVGSFRHGMNNLKERGFVPAIKSFAANNGVLLGICLGMQLLFEEGYEFGHSQGLGLIPGKVVQLPPEKLLKLPRSHVTWNSIHKPGPHVWNETILDSIQNGSDVYFVHRFFGEPANTDQILSLTTYGDIEFCSAIRHGNIYGTQFHPEKSGKIGLSIFSNLINLVLHSKNIVQKR